MAEAGNVDPAQELGSRAELAALACGRSLALAVRGSLTLACEGSLALACGRGRSSS